MTLVFMAASARRVRAGRSGLLPRGWRNTRGCLDASAQNQRLSIALVSGMTLGILAWVAWFVASNPKEDRGPVITIFVFMLFNAFFWVAFEQAGSSLNVFTEQNTDSHAPGLRSARNVVPVRERRPDLHARSALRHGLDQP